jgi:pimeloyl-ACP methyl ester carboxylesterase
VTDKKNKAKANLNSTNIGEEKKEEAQKTSYIPCLYLPYSEGSDKILIFFHGNAEDIGWSLSFVTKLQKILKVHVLSMEYPGYGLYIGKPNANKILEDAEIVFNYLTQTVGVREENIILFGRSIGSGPATFLAARKKVASLILMSAYTSIKAAVKNIAGNFAKMLVAERFKNIEEISKVKSPILFIHGIKDTLIPKQHSVELLNACLQTVSHIHLSEDMTHNDYDIEYDIIEPSISFLERCGVKIKNEGTQYEFPPEVTIQPEATKNQQNKRSYVSKMYDKYNN